MNEDEYVCGVEEYCPEEGRDMGGFAEYGTVAAFGGIEHGELQDMEAGGGVVRCDYGEADIVYVCVDCGRYRKEVQQQVECRKSCRPDKGVGVTHI